MTADRLIGGHNPIAKDKSMEIMWRVERRNAHPREKRWPDGQSIWPCIIIYRMKMNIDHWTVIAEMWIVEGVRLAVDQRRIFSDRPKSM